MWAVGQTVRESSSLHLITQHGTDLSVARRYYDQPYLDFSGVQSGAGWEDALLVLANWTSGGL